MSADDRTTNPEFERQLQEASARVQTLHADLYADYPALQGNLSIAGMLIGQGLGMFVANGLADDQIVTHVLTIVAQIRQSLGQSAARDDATVH